MDLPYNYIVNNELRRRSFQELIMVPPDRPCQTLTAPSDPRMFSVVRTFVEAVCQACRVDPPIIHAVVLATGEAVTNVVRHAHCNRPEQSFRLQCRVAPDMVEVILLDQGKPFDLTQVPNLDPAELRLGGRGVYLMRALMDEISCQSLGERGNCLRLIKRRQ
jgi:anti-sigma regulatory factor (Ser/Thr protein kinase)